jgi:HPt (histidine-containing phosphotransfer) domain-containing protein
MTPQTPVYSRFAQDPDLEYVIADFVTKHLPERIAAVEECVRSSDWQTLEAEIQRLKGSSACYGFAEVSARADQLAAACQEQAIEEEILGLTADLAAICRRVRVGAPR